MSPAVDAYDAAAGGGVVGRPRSGRDGSRRGTRPDHAAGGPQGPGELPRRAIGEPPGSRRHLDNHPVRIPPRRRRGGLIRRTDHERKAAIDMAKYVLALDQGTTSSRAILFNADGTIHTTAKPGVPPDLPIARPRRARSRGDLGLAARRRQEGDRGRRRVARRHRRHRHHQPARDDDRLGQEHRASRSRTRSSGRAASRPGTATSSRRPATRTKFREKTGLPIDAYFSGTKIRHILQNNSGAQERAEAGELLFGTVDSFLIWRLTEGKRSRRRLLEREPHACCSTSTRSTGTTSCWGS